MNKKWIEYSTEDGERWEIFKDITDIDDDSDYISLLGNRAVYKKTMLPTDVVMVCIVPSERIVDNMTKQIIKKNLYHLMLRLLNDTWFCLSINSYSKEEVVQLSNLFVGLNKTQAERVWKAKKLGELNTYRIDKNILP